MLPIKAGICIMALGLKIFQLRHENIDDDKNLVQVQVKIEARGVGLDVCSDGSVPEAGFGRSCRSQHRLSV